MGRCATETDDAKGLYEMSLEVFDNYECDGQIEISDLKGEEMEKLIYIPAEQIHEHPDNPRKNLGDLEELSESIKKKGIMQNLTVMIGHWDEKGKWQQDGYTLLIGHRRFAAGKMAAVSEFPCRVIEKIDYKDQIGIMMEENMQRNDLTIWEEANGFQMMLDLGDTEEQIAEKTGFSKSTIKHRLNIAKLDQDVLKEKEQNDGYQLTLKGLYELEKITDIDKRNEILRQSGSSVDLVARARSAVVSERREKVKQKIISALEASGAKKMSDKDEMSVWDSGKWKKIQEYKTDNDPGEIDVPESDEQLYWRSIWSGIEVYKKKKPAKKKETKAERLEKERKAKQKHICFLCARNGDYRPKITEEHHVFFGSGLRDVSEENGFKCDLCIPHHRTGPEAVHNNQETREYLCRIFQQQYERTHTHEEFMELVHKNYL